MVLDILALVVLGVLIAAAIAIVVALGRMPGVIARRRNHPQADAITVLGWLGIITLGLGWAIALVWAHTRPREQRIEVLEQRIERLEAGGGSGIVIAFLTLCYGAIYWVCFVKLGLFARTPRNVSIFAGIGVVLIGAVVFVWLAVAPTTKDGRMFEFVIQIVPNVSGTVVEVPIEPLVPLAKGDVLYRINPTPFQAEVDRIGADIEQIAAQEKLAQIQVERERKLVKGRAGAQQDLDRWVAELASTEASRSSLDAQLRKAEWMLDETTVRAPHSGYVFNLQLRPGTFVTSASTASALAFVSDERRELIATFSQSSVRLVEPGDPAEVVFGNVPGRVFSGRVAHLAQATGAAQLDASGVLPTFTGTPVTARYLVRITLDDDDPGLLPQGAAGTVAVYTDHGTPVHIITKVVMRMQAWLAYLTDPG